MRISQFMPVSRRSGVTASVQHSSTSVHVPVERVTNSSGLAPYWSVAPSTASRRNGTSASSHTAILTTRSCLGDSIEGSIFTVRPQKDLRRSMPVYSDATWS